MGETSRHDESLQYTHTVYTYVVYSQDVHDVWPVLYPNLLAGITGISKASVEGVAWQLCEAVAYIVLSDCVRLRQHLLKTLACACNQQPHCCRI